MRVHNIADDPEGLRNAIVEARRNYKGVKPHANIADVVKHINHVADIAGVDKWPNLTRALLEEGYSREDALKIYRENTLRVMMQVQKVAASLK